MNTVWVTNSHARVNPYCKIVDGHTDKHMTKKDKLAESLTTISHQTLANDADPDLISVLTICIKDRFL